MQRLERQDAQTLLCAAARVALAAVEAENVTGRAPRAPLTNDERRARYQQRRALHELKQQLGA